MVGYTRPDYESRNFIFTTKRVSLKTGLKTSIFNVSEELQVDNYMRGGFYVSQFDAGDDSEVFYTFILISILIQEFCSQDQEQEKTRDRAITAFDDVFGKALTIILSLYTLLRKLRDP